jgi:phosphoglycolate phosphatase-like HAD superfamily hydrolase
MHVCLFDIDGTLLSSGGAGKEAMEAALVSEFGVPPDDPARGIPFAGRTDRAITRDLFAQHGIEASPANWQRFLRAYLTHLPVCLAQRDGAVLPGIEELLAHLSSRADITLGLLTGNVRDGARHKLERYRLDRHFAFGGFGDYHHDRNDVAREAYTEVHRHLRGIVDMNRVWVIGDTPFDVACGRAIGARVIAVATGGHTLDQLAAAEPDCLLQDCSDMARLLELWR